MKCLFFLNLTQENLINEDLEEDRMNEWTNFIHCAELGM